jgi:hypothetical protein
MGRFPARESIQSEEMNWGFVGKLNINKQTAHGWRPLGWKAYMTLHYMPGKVHEIGEKASLDATYISYRRLSSAAFLASRLNVGFSKHNGNAFESFYLDVTNYLRGGGYRYIRSTAKAVVNTELHFSLYENWGWRLGLVLFEDAALVKMNNPSKWQAVSFTGVGGRLFIKKPFEMLLRGDLGVSTAGHTQKWGMAAGLNHFF